MITIRQVGRVRVQVEDYAQIIENDLVDLYHVQVQPPQKKWLFFESEWETWVITESKNEAMKVCAGLVKRLSKEDGSN